MDCIVPGRVLLAPAVHGIIELEGLLREQISLDLRLDYAIDDIVDRYARELPDRDAFARAGKEGRPAPYVALVPEGAEDEASERLAKLKFVDAACPDYQFRPAADVVTVDWAAIQSAIDVTGATPAGHTCGHARIGILDSGVDASLLGDPAKVDAIQFDVTDPQDSGRAPSDRHGHGTLIAAIIQRVAPAAALRSIRVYDGGATVSGVLAGLYLAGKLGCDIVNLSLSVSCDPDRCKVCGHSGPVATNAAQLAFFFERFQAEYPEMLLVAAAGNHAGRKDPPVALPAAFPDILAVGEFDVAQSEPTVNSRYRQVPEERYVLAPGGAFGTRPGYNQPKPLAGTSFSTAFASGVAARLACAYKGGPCGGGATGLLRAFVLDQIAKNADSSWTGFEAEKHGLGVLRYQVPGPLP